MQDTDCVLCEERTEFLLLHNSDECHFNTTSTLLTAHLFRENVWGQSGNCQSSKFSALHRNKYRVFMYRTASFSYYYYSPTTSSSPTQFSKFSPFASIVEQVLSW